jgi:hypothetical protein
MRSMDGVGLTGATCWYAKNGFCFVRLKAKRRKPSRLSRGPKCPVALALDNEAIQIVALVVGNKLLRAGSIWIRFESPPKT